MHDTLERAPNHGTSSGAPPSGFNTAWLAPDYRIIARLPPNPEPERGAPPVYFMASSMAQQLDGTLVAAIARGDRTPGRGKHLTHIVVCNSRDGGETWRQVSVLPYDSCEPVLYVHQGRLYQFITPNRGGTEHFHYFDRSDNGRIWVSASDDAGATWSDPVIVLRGAPQYTSGGQASLAVRNGCLYWTVSERYQTLAALRCRLDLGILNPAAWQVSELAEMPIPAELVHGEFSDGSVMRCLEGNVVEVNGRLLVLARAVINRYGTSNMGAVFQILDDDPAAAPRLVFRQLYPIPGGQCKFYIQYDAVSRLYWMASNLPTNSQDLIGLGDTLLGALVNKRRDMFSLREDRRLLTLWYSLDALNWIPAGWIARAEGWTQSFMYPVFEIAGDDLVLISRTARDSGNFHDVDLATFHRIRDFRRLAAPLCPSVAPPAQEAST